MAGLAAGALLMHEGDKVSECYLSHLLCACVVRVVTNVRLGVQRSTGRETSINGKRTLKVADMEMTNVAITSARKNMVEVDMVVALVVKPSLKTTHMLKTIVTVGDIGLSLRP